jgi:hypothetical protein
MEEQPHAVFILATSQLVEVSVTRPTVGPEGPEGPEDRGGRDIM